MRMYTVLYLLRWVADISSLLLLTYNYEDPSIEVSPFVLVFSLPMVGIRSCMSLLFPCYDMAFFTKMKYCPDRIMSQGNPYNALPVYGAVVTL